MTIFPRHISIICLIFAFFGSAAAQDIYPEKIATIEDFKGGELVPAKSVGSSEKQLLYLVKPNWTGEKESIFALRGFSDEAKIGSSLGEAYVFASETFGDKLWIAWTERSVVGVAIVDSRAQIAALKELPLDADSEITFEAEWIGEIASGEKVMLLNERLFFVRREKSGALNAKLIDNFVVAATCDSALQKTFYVKQNQTVGSIYQIDSSGSRTHLANVRLFGEVRLIVTDRFIAGVVGDGVSSSSVISINKHTGRPEKLDLRLPCAANEVAIKGGDSARKVFYVDRLNEEYFVSRKVLDSTGRILKESKTEMPREFVDPYSITATAEGLAIVFRNGIVRLNDELDIISSDFLALSEYFDEAPQVAQIEEKLFLSSRANSFVVFYKKNRFWRWNCFVRSGGKFAIPAAFGLLTLLFAELYRRQKRLVKELIGFETFGAALVFDRFGRLIGANEKGKEFLGISEAVPLHKNYSYYLASESMKPIGGMIRAAMEHKEIYTRKFTIVENKLEKEYLCVAAPRLNFAGSLRGAIFTAADITEELERKRLSNWAQLAHDMQTNLAVVKLNAEQLASNASDEDANRIKKILRQTQILISRVRDIVTVGRADSFRRIKTYSSEICAEVYQEFDPDMFPGAEIELECEAFSLECDRPKLVRALRNAAENSLKALGGEPGIIRIGCRRSGRKARFYVTDDGPGMNEETLDKMTTPYFSGSKDRSGSGIGAMIMQRAAELHGGKLKVYSEPGKGTEVVFEFPIFSTE